MAEHATRAALAVVAAAILVLVARVGMPTPRAVSLDQRAVQVAASQCKADPTCIPSVDKLVRLASGYCTCCPALPHPALPPPTPVPALTLPACAHASICGLPHGSHLADPHMRARPHAQRRRKGAVLRVQLGRNAARVFPR
jgi:hypothetical protein